MIGKPKSEAQDCWIAPDGKVTWAYSDEDGGYLGSHSEVAREVLGDDTGGAQLERKGYLHVSGGSIYTGYNDTLGRSIAPTQSQIDVVFDLVQTVEANYPKSSYAVRYRRWIEEQQAAVLA